MDDRDSTPLEAESILTTLIEHGVEFVVIGGVAAQTYGRMRMTADVDIIPKPEPANLAQLAEALRALDSHVLNVMHEVPGGRSYDELQADALVIELDGTPVSIVSLDDLIAMKLARGRPVDIEDVAALTDAEQG